MLSLIDTGEPVTRKTLTHLGDWAIWVTLLLGLERGSGVLGEDVSRRLLLARFDQGPGGPPRGVRVYAARIATYAEPAEPPVVPFAVALHGDRRVVLDPDGTPIGYSVLAGPMDASESIAVGKLALLVVGRTYPSGADHDERLDRAAASVGLERIHPLGACLPALTPRSVNMRDVARLFTVVPIGADPSLMPITLQSMWA